MSQICVTQTALVITFEGEWGEVQVCEHLFFGSSRFYGGGRVYRAIGLSPQQSSEQSKTRTKASALSCHEC